MNTERPLDEFAPIFEKDEYAPADFRSLEPFFTNLDKSVYVPMILAPELIGALCSRTSRAPEDLRTIYLREFMYPFINPVREPKDTDETWQEKITHGKALEEFIEFLHSHSLFDVLANPRARSFYIRWLAEYGDDSIAQMAGTHLVFSGISQITIKHFEDQRIGLAPIEKSTRYVNYTRKVGGSYLYYTDPTLKDMGLGTEYRKAMDNLFETYARLIPRMTSWLKEKFPEEKTSVIEKKTFDTLRGLLPSATLSQVAFFGNGQAFEHMMNRSARHPLGEIRWAADAAYQELNRVVPSFLRRVKDPERQDIMNEYQEYLTGKDRRIASFTPKPGPNLTHPSPIESHVTLTEWDPDGELKVITGMLFTTPNNHASWEETLAYIKQMSEEEQEKVVATYLKGRTQRWQKPGRAFENTYVRFEIVMNIGAWRDLQRHRMLTQQRQRFSCRHGYDLPQEVVDAGLAGEYREAIKTVEDLYFKIEAHDPDLAQYATTLAHRIRFMQWENLRQSFWQIELRTIPEGHPDYRHIEQEKFRLLAEKFPLLTKHMRANMGEYDFARRGQEEKIQKKLDQLGG